MSDDAERTLVDAGRAGLVERLRGTTRIFVGEHRLALATLREDVTGDFRQGGVFRILFVLLCFPLALPLAVYVARNVAGMGVEWLGAVSSVLCVVIAGAIVAISRGRPLDRMALGIHATATASVVGGAAFAWTTFGAEAIAIVGVVCAVVMLTLLMMLVVARLRGREIGRLRDSEAMDRAEDLRSALRASLERDAGSSVGDPTVHAFLDELVSTTVPMPTRRLFADTRPLDQRLPRTDA